VKRNDKKCPSFSPMICSRQSTTHRCIRREDAGERFVAKGKRKERKEETRPTFFFQFSHFSILFAQICNLKKNKPQARRQ
jgi:hypothetical protein